MYEAPLLAINTGIPAIVMTFTTGGRTMIAIGCATIALGAVHVALWFRASRLVERTFELEA